MKFELNEWKAGFWTINPKEEPHMRLFCDCDNLGLTAFKDIATRFDSRKEALDLLQKWRDENEPQNVEDV